MNTQSPSKGRVPGLMGKKDQGATRDSACEFNPIGLPACAHSLPALRRLWEAGISTVEALIALVICAIAVSGGFLVNSHELAIVKSARETSGACGVLEERVEQLRTATWKQITDATYLSDGYFAVQPKSIAALSNYREQIKVSAWPDESAATPLLVEKTPKAEPAVLQAGAGLPDQRMAKVDVRVYWLGRNGRPRMRDLTTIISNGGISRMNLPVMGDPAGTGNWGDLATPPPSATPTPTPTPTNNGNGNGSSGNSGRGNVAGKPGKN